VPEKSKLAFSLVIFLIIQAFQLSTNIMTRKIKMQTIRLRSQVDSDGSLQLQLNDLPADCELEIVLVYQPIDNVTPKNILTSQKDSLIGLFAESSDLAEKSEDIQNTQPNKILDLEDQPFVGMWSDRPETQDSKQWLRNVRKQHWHN
jgi:hypothetical protein